MNRFRLKWRFQFSLRTLLVFYGIMSIGCWYLRFVTIGQPETSKEPPWPDPAQRNSYMAQLREMPDDQLEAAISQPAPNRSDSQPDEEACLVEIARRSAPHDPRWASLLQKMISEISGPKDAKEVSFPTANMELLATLCRVNREPDPLAFELNEPSQIVCELPNRPMVRIQLVNRDVEKRLLTSWPGGDYRSGRLTKFMMDVYDESGALVPFLPKRIGFGGGLSGFDEWKWGEPVKHDLPVDDYAVVSRPGAFWIHVVYSPGVQIADEGHTVGRVVFRSRPIRLFLTVPTTKVSPTAGTDARRWIDALPNKGAVVVVRGQYGPWFDHQIPPESAAAHLLGMGFCAVPEMLNELRDPSISVQRRAWMLALLFSVTGCNDPLPVGDLSFLLPTPVPLARIFEAHEIDGPPGHAPVYETSNEVNWQSLAKEGNPELRKRQIEFGHRWDGWEKFLPGNPVTLP